MSKQTPCTICKNAFLRATVDRLLDEKMSFAGISRYAAEADVTIASEVISRHSKHYKPDPVREKGTPKRDFAILIRDRAYDGVESGELGLNNPKLVPGVNAGLKAQAILDGRDRVKTKQQSADLAFAILRMLGGNTEPLAIEDGMTIDGDYEVVDGETE